MPDQHRTFHIVTEAASVALIAPYLLSLAERSAGRDATLLRLIAWSCICVDGLLLLLWFE